MALDKATLKSVIEAGVKGINLSSSATDVPAAIAQVLADAIDAYVKTATVSTTVTGTCATPAGAGTISGTGTGTLS